MLGPRDEVVAYAMLTMAWYIYRYKWIALLCQQISELCRIVRAFFFFFSVGKNINNKEVTINEVLSVVVYVKLV